MNNNHDLKGTIALVHPELPNDPANQQGQIGIITYIDPSKDELYLSFKNGREAVYSADALLKLPDRQELMTELMNNTDHLVVDDFKDLYKIGMLLDRGSSRDTWRALEIARDNPAIWSRALITPEVEKSRDFSQSTQR